MTAVKKTARPPHLTNKSLIALGELTKLSKWGAVKNFVTTLGPKWPEGRTILYDLLKNSDRWFRLVFTYRPIHKEGTTTYYEIKLAVSIYPDRADKFYELVREWPECLPPPEIPGGHLFSTHMSTTQKIFETKTNGFDYASRNYETLVYSKYFYSTKTPKFK